VRVDVEHLDDPRLDPYRSLRGRPSSDDVFVVEGLTTLRQAVSAGVRLRSALVLPGRAAEVSDLDVPVLVAAREVLEAIVGFDVHRGVLALADRPPERDVDQVLAASRRVLVVDGISDAENVGALFRNAAAFGVDAVVLDGRSCDPLLRRCVRVSVGTVLRVPFARADDWRARLAGFTVLALSPRGDTALDALRPPDRWALAVGAEGPGLADAVLAGADVRVRIPMADGVDSLNVATAAAVALYALS
jgi:tRNA G18 (ribose-2'-O)-methylase SpoU